MFWKKSELEIKEGRLIRCKNKSIKSITIPSNVRVIKKNAFRDCHDLVTVIIKIKDIYLIESRAFNNCPRLKTIQYVTESWKHYLQYIEDECFYKCDSLSNFGDEIKQKLDILQKLYKIINTYVHIPSNSLIIHELIKLVTETIKRDRTPLCADSLFKNLIKFIEGIEIKDSVAVGLIKERLLSDSCNLISRIVHLKEETIPYYSEIKELTLSRCKIVEDSVFHGNKWIEKVDLMDVEVLGYSCFDGCINLREIDISRVKKISNGRVFRNCKSLPKIGIGLELLKEAKERYNCETAIWRFMEDLVLKHMVDKKVPICLEVELPQLNSLNAELVTNDYFEHNPNKKDMGKFIDLMLFQEFEKINPLISLQTLICDKNNNNNKRKNGKKSKSGN